MTTPVYWCGYVPPACQITRKPFGGLMYHCNLPGYGWCNCGDEAFTQFGGTLGTGRGQKYALQNDGRWLKVGG